MKNFLRLALSLLLALAPAAGTAAPLFTAPAAVSFSTAIAVNAPTVVQLQGSDADGTPLTYAITSSPAHGALAQLDTSTGVVVYTPTNGYTGSDSFNYTVSSGGDTTAAATVTITVTGAKTRVVDTFTNPDGSARQGKVSFFLTQVASSPSGLIPAKSSVTCALTSAGVCDVQLYPSRAVSPAQFYQAWYYDQNGNSQLLGIYDIPAATGTITLAGHRVTDASLQAQFVFASRAEIEALMQVVQDATAALNNFPPPSDSSTLADGLSAFWNLNETTGSRLDSSNYHYLTPGSTVSSAAGKRNKAAHFGGGWLAIPDSASISGGGTSRGHTFSAWVKPSALDGTRIVAHKVLADGTEKEFGLYFNSGIPTFLVSSDGANWTGTVTAPSVSTGAWHFYCGWYDAGAGTLNLQVDDGVVNSVSYTGGVRDGSASLYLGNWAGNTSALAGDLDAAGLWQRALTAGERSMLYNGGNGREGPFSFTLMGASVPGEFDANRPPFSCVPNDGTDQTPCLRALVNANKDFALASGNTPVIDDKFNPGNYKLTSAVQVVGNCRAQVCLPELGEGQRPVISFTSKIPTLSNTPYGPEGASGANSGNVVFESTLSPQSVTSDGKPFIFGGPDALKTGAPSRMAFYTKAITVRGPSNPGVGGLNCELLDRCVLDDTRFDTADPNLGYPATAAEPTHPTGISVLMPVNNLNGAEYRGTVEVTGWFAGPPITELTSSSNRLYSVQNKVGFNLQTPWFQFGEFTAYSVRNPYGIAQVDASSGIVAPTGIATTDRSFFVANISFEDAQSGWQMPVAHVNDPNSKLKGRLTFLHLTSNVGNLSTGLTLNGASNLTLINLGQ